MECAKDVVLHVYELQPSGNASFFSRMLGSLGHGAYHTSLEVDGYRYTFAANAGIVKTASRNEGVPPGATYKEAIPLGSCSCTRGEINAILKNLGENFHGRSYHLVHRNCNHFTATLATAIILNDQLVDPKQGRLNSYPEWINRLASSSSMVISHDDDIVPCNVMTEARKASGADGKIGWDLRSSQTGNASASKSSTQQSSKKQLTDKQKAMLARIKGS
eukprot:CAMPEP_0202484384 /NCGR_PEP_ID=MMETSP1361-20130828/3466_1 /ASSEMBLY_ACC=CAM_ASM_000849 /TAXON_ID=210615 /ORGANISM="Staurosira complex sp., Strain CCMP2646" /LENGTH=218 /DNA_ID=CAMNT_0049113005 /DNA_START=95 /DNA_END=751 /DNA_ORIENTATION=+